MPTAKRDTGLWQCREGQGKSKVRRNTETLPFIHVLRTLIVMHTNYLMNPQIVLVLLASESQRTVPDGELSCCGAWIV